MVSLPGVAAAGGDSAAIRLSTSSTSNWTLINHLRQTGDPNARIAQDFFLDYSSTLGDSSSLDPSSGLEACLLF